LKHLPYGALDERARRELKTMFLHAVWGAKVGVDEELTRMWRES